MDPIEYEDFSKVQLLVVTIKEVAPIEGADKLLKLTVDDGTPEPRTIAAGIKKHYPDPQVLVGTQVVIVANLKPKTLKGVESRGMILAATDYNVENPMRLIAPAGPIAAGTRCG